MAMLDIYSVDSLIDAENHDIYKLLNSANVQDAFDTTPGHREFNVGLRASAHLLLTAFERSRGCPQPSVMFLESSLFPERTRLRDVLRDFMLLYHSQNIANDKAEDLKYRFRLAYRYTYWGLRELGTTIFDHPEFFQSTNKMIAWCSECHTARTKIRQTSTFTLAERKLKQIIARYKSTDEEYRRKNKTLPNDFTWFPLKDSKIPLYQGIVPLRKAAHKAAVDELSLRERIILFHKRFHEESLHEFETSYLLSIPLLGSSEGGDAKGLLSGLGAIFILIAFEDSSYEPALLRRTLKKLPCPVSYLIKDFFASYLYTSSRQLTYKALQTSLRAAVAAIMGRVNAHDMGHVLAHARLPEDEDGSLIKPEGYFRQMINYLQHRMVFAAEASAGDPSWTTTHSFMSQVITAFGKIIYLDFDEGPTAILQHIAESEQVEKINVVVTVDGVELHHQYDIETGIYQTRPNDLTVVIPGGTVGCHAFYSILENVIRNGAKYGARRAKTLTLHIDLAYKTFDNPELFRVHVWEDHSIFDRDAYKEVARHIQPSAVEGEISETYDRELSSDRWRFIDEEGQLMSGGFGIKEMRICAAWLRAEPLLVALAPSKRYNPALLKPIRIYPQQDSMSIKAQAEEETYLGYEFYLLRPKEAIIFDQASSQWTNGIGDFLDSYGVDVKNNFASETSALRRHRTCIIRLPSIKEENEGWTRRLHELHSELPINLYLATEPSARDAGRDLSYAVQIGIDDFEQLTSSLRAQKPDDLFRLRVRWLKQVLEIPDDLVIVFHLNAQIDNNAPESLVEAWREAGHMLRSVAAGWRLCVEDSSVFDVEDVDSSTLLMFDNHGVFRQNVTPEEFALCDFYERLGRLNATQVILYNPPEDLWARVKILVGMIESAFAKVAIVDERLWARLRKPGKHELAGEATTLEKLRIFLPDLQTAGYDKPSREHALRLSESFKRMGIHICSIHQGMLDKFFSGCTKLELENWIQSLLESIPIVITHSDRGERLLPRLPSRVRFVPYSAISPWLLGDLKSKFNLTQTLLDAKKGGGPHAGTDSYH